MTDFNKIITDKITEMDEKEIENELYNDPENY